MFGLLSLVACVLFAGGCSKKDVDIEDRFFECRDLVADKEMRDEALKCFTNSSRDVLSALLKQKKRTSSALNYMRNFSKLLDYETVAAPPDVRDDIALLLVRKGSRQETIYFIKEENEWRIDALELRGFWAPLDNKDGQ